MSIDDYCSYMNRRKSPQVSAAQESSLDELADTIRTQLLNKRTGILVDEDEMPDHMLSLFHPTLKVVKGNRK